MVYHQMMSLVSIPNIPKCLILLKEIVLSEYTASFNPRAAELFLYNPWKSKGFFQFESIINVLVVSFRFI